MAEMYNVIPTVYGTGQRCSFEDRNRAKLFAQDLATLDSVGRVVVTSEFRTDENDRPVKIFDTDTDCGAESPSGELGCSRPWGHTGDHSAAGGGVEWKRSDDERNALTGAHSGAGRDGNG